MSARRARNFTVNFTTRPMRSLSDSDFARFVSALELAPELAAPAPAAHFTTGTLRLTASVDGASEEAAFSRAVRAFRRVLSNLSVPTAIAEATIEEDNGETISRHELVTGAEVARRLGISRERVRQLAADKKRFPQARFALGKAFVWHWGDIIDWADIEGREIETRTGGGNLERGSSRVVSRVAAARG
jgi:predicted DNA-binding transcriptional regulator AlpA